MMLLLVPGEFPKKKYIYKCLLTVPDLYVLRQPVLEVDSLNIRANHNGDWFLC